MKVEEFKREVDDLYEGVVQHRIAAKEVATKLRALHHTATDTYFREKLLDAAISAENYAKPNNRDVTRARQELMLALAKVRGWLRSSQAHDQ